MTTGTKFGIAWRPELALLIEEEELRFTEVLAENYWKEKSLPRSLAQLVERGTTVIPHGVSLSLGGAEEPDLWRLEKLANLATQLHAPYVSEHIALVRGGGYESGHLLPIERTEEMLEIVIENVRIAQRNLPVPLVLENIATIVDWNNAQMTEGQFISAVLRETGAKMLLDVSNLYVNCYNHGRYLSDFLNSIPLDQIEYVHVAGGAHRDRLYHDTHTHSLGEGPLNVLAELCRRIIPPAVLLERDDHFAKPVELLVELARIQETVESALTVTT